MIIFPAIDLSLGKIVRLEKGDFEKTIYSSNVISQITRFEKEGAIWVHVVDLDGALSGKNENQNVIKDILSSTKCVAFN